MNHTTARSARAAVAAHAALADARKLLGHMEHEAALDVDLGPTNWGQAMLDLATTSLDTVDALLADGRWPPYSPLPRTWHDLETEAAQAPAVPHNARNPCKVQHQTAGPGWLRGVLVRLRTLAR